MSFSQTQIFSVMQLRVVEKLLHFAPAVTTFLCQEILMCSGVKEVSYEET